MARRSIARTSAAGLVLAALVCVPVPAVAAPLANGPLRVLVIGDSMTQGSAGDWTWRYRLWKHFDDNGVDVDFVGPRDDLFDNLTFDFGSYDYVDPAFDQDHAARWGLSLAFPDEHQSIGQLVTDFHPDVVVEMLGVNDLTWLQGSPDDVINGLRSWVREGQGIDPDVDFVLARIPQPWLDKVPLFNAKLDDLADELGTVDSAVVVADSDAGLVLGEDTWDDHHPNAMGEVKIAAGVADALSELGAGPPAERPLPIVPRGPRIPPVLAVSTPQLRSADLSWLRSPGSTESEVWLRDLTAGGAWHRVLEHVTDDEVTLTNLPGWHRLQLRTAPWKGSWRAAEDAWSNIVEVEVPDDRLDRPVVRADAGRDGVATLSWPLVPGATSYAAQWRRADQPGVWHGAAATGTGFAQVSGLAGRTAYTFRVRAERAALASGFSAETTVTVPPLAAVRGAHVEVLQSGRLKASAQRLSGAKGYTLRVASARNCVRAPKDRRFDVVASGLTRPAKRFRVDARAVWVRWVAVRGGVEGEIAASSTDCVRLR